MDQPGEGKQLLPQRQYNCFCGGQIIAKGCPKKENYWAPQAPMAGAKRAMRRSMPAGVRSAAS